MLDYRGLNLPAGFMTDGDLKGAITGGFLFEPNTCHVEGVKHASYLLRVGHKVEYPREGGGADQDRRTFRLQRLAAGEFVELKPGSTALVLPVERFRLPDSVLAFTIPRGFLFAESLVVATSYIDPGFVGDFYIPITNVSDRLVRLPVGLEIARVFFYELGRSVGNSYSAASTTGLTQELESLPPRRPPTLADCRGQSADKLTKAVQETTPGGAELVELFARARRRAFWLASAAVAWSSLLALLLIGTVRQTIGRVADGTATLVGGIVASLIAAAIVSAIGLYRSRQRSLPPS